MTGSNSSSKELKSFSLYLFLKHKLIYVLNHFYWPILLHVRICFVYAKLFRTVTNKTYNKLIHLNI